MKRHALIGSLVACAVLTACATGPVYRPAEKPGDYGYRDTLLTSDRYRVSFAGGYSTPRETVENFALFRAADLALSHGAQRFRIVSRQTSPITTNDYGPTTSIGYGWGYPFWGTGIGFSTAGSSETRYETVLEIQIGADVPEDGPDVYNALELKRNLSADVAAGGAK